MREVEIIDEENTITFSDEHQNLSMEFFPNSKEFKSNMSLTEDVYYRNERYEYKINLDPIEVLVRLKERSDEPPLRYAVKDGVVLESEIKKDGNIFSDSQIKDLKEAVEWHKLELANACVQFFYILSKHPEIISPEEYRKFLRQTEQRIKNGLFAVEKRIREKDKTGLQIIDGEFGKQIWYEISKEKEVSEKERKQQFEYTENIFYKPLFNKKSLEYSGISRSEFISSLDIINHIEELFDEKKIASSDEVTMEDSKKKQWNWIGYTWAVVVNLITIVVIFSIYEKVTRGFETIAISILILIYLSLRSFVMLYGKTIIENAFALDAEFKHIRKLLKDEQSKNEKDEISEAKKNVDKATRKMYINVFFLSIMYLIAIFSLLGSL
jgi:hypothetical protein